MVDVEVVVISDGSPDPAQSGALSTHKVRPQDLTPVVVISHAVF
jgi:hypothetical protein